MRTTTTSQHSHDKYDQQGVQGVTLPQPTAFNALLHGLDGECPCCRSKFGKS